MFRFSCRPKKALIIGIDGTSPESIQRFIDQDRLPNLKELLERGVSANALPVLPTHTPVNWATLATGAWPGTHGITGFSIHHRGEPLNVVHSGFDTKEIQAEFLWNAAERAGKKSIVMKWAGPTFPVTLKKGIQVDGCFCVSCIHEITGPKLYSSEKTPQSVKISLNPSSGWKKIPCCSLTPLESELNIDGQIHNESDNSSQRTINVSAKLHLLFVDSDGKHYDRLIVSRTKNVEDQIGILKVGQWSKWVEINFRGEGFSAVGTLRLKLLELSDSSTKIFCSQIMPTSGWTYPEEIAAELTKNVGPFLQRPGYYQYPYTYGGWAGRQTLMEEMEYQHDWFARATGYLLDKHDWDLFFMQTHAGDYIFDHLVKDAEPLTSASKEESNKCIELIGKTFEQVDKMIGRILSHVSIEETLIAVVSDHGVIGYPSHISARSIVRDLLIENNLLFYKDEKGRPRGPGSKPEQGRSNIDWKRTKAQVQDTIFINLNVKGREPNGVVEPHDFLKTRDEIIQALLNYKDPKLGICPFSLVLRSEDARILGLYGDRIGDIVYTVREGTLSGEGHGVQLPTAKYGMSSLRALFILAGPGIKKSYKLKQTVWLTDLAPTVAYLMGIPSPRQADGSVLYEAFEEI
jgi:predicted AlkP superfamily phosphohydrolase/phosphomutase